MRITSVAALVLAAAAAVLPASPAAAYCDPLVSSVTGGCDTPCTVVGKAFGAVAREVGLSDDWHCSD